MLPPTSECSTFDVDGGIPFLSELTLFVSTAAFFFFLDVFEKVAFLLKAWPLGIQSVVGFIAQIFSSVFFFAATRHVLFFPPESKEKLFPESQTFFPLIVSLFSHMSCQVRPPPADDDGIYIFFSPFCEILSPVFLASNFFS